MSGFVAHLARPAPYFYVKPMHSITETMIFVQMLILAGLPLSALFILLFMASLFFARSRAFARRLLILSLGLGITASGDCGLR